MFKGISDDEFIYYIYVKCIFVSVAGNVGVDLKCLFKTKQAKTLQQNADIQPKEDALTTAKNPDLFHESTPSRTMLDKNGKLLGYLPNGSTVINPSCKYIIYGNSDIVEYAPTCKDWETFLLVSALTCA
ncbi:hypothetical protein IWW57_000508 [Coemansia sp. S610]|nr:hypothetical protein IWW57_000508 [Coemansia sp. S610]